MTEEDLDSIFDYGHYVKYVDDIFGRLGLGSLLVTNR